MLITSPSPTFFDSPPTSTSIVSRSDRSFNTVAVAILTPLIVPVYKHVGLDPVHFGILMTAIVNLGPVTSSAGVALYTAGGLLDCRFKDYLRHSIPSIVVIPALIAGLSLVPELPLFSARLLF